MSISYFIQSAHAGNFSGVYGDGISRGGHSTSSTEGTQNFNFDIRFGTDFSEILDCINTSSSRCSQLSNQDSKPRLDFIYINEGHPTNNHRDGFSVQVLNRIPVSDNVDSEFGIGPYYSMNTTTVDNEQWNEHRMGVLATAALLMHLNSIYPGLSLKMQLNAVEVKGDMDTASFMVGFNQDFLDIKHPSQKGYGNNTSDQESVWVSGLFGSSKTNHAGSPAAAGGGVEIKKEFSKHTAASVAWLEEGDDGVRVDRKGIELQGWYIEPLTPNLSASMGIGPYYNYNKRENRGSDFDANISFQIDRTMGRKKLWKIGVRLTRVANHVSDKNDRDLTYWFVARKI